MKQIIKYLIIIITINSLLFSLNETQNEEYEKLVTKITQKIIEKWQYSPKEVDDIYSILVYDVFMDRMDYDRKYFLTNEIFVFGGMLVAIQAWDARPGTCMDLLFFNFLIEILIFW